MRKIHRNVLCYFEELFNEDPSLDHYMLKAETLLRFSAHSNIYEQWLLADDPYTFKHNFYKNVEFRNIARSQGINLEIINEYKSQYDWTQDQGITLPFGFHEPGYIPFQTLDSLRLLFGSIQDYQLECGNKISSQNIDFLFGNQKQHRIFRETYERFIDSGEIIVDGYTLEERNKAVNSLIKGIKSSAKSRKEEIKYSSTLKAEHEVNSLNRILSLINLAAERLIKKDVVIPQKLRNKEFATYFAVLKDLHPLYDVNFGNKSGCCLLVQSYSPKMEKPEINPLRKSYGNVYSMLYEGIFEFMIYQEIGEIARPVGMLYAVHINSSQNNPYLVANSLEFSKYDVALTSQDASALCDHVHQYVYQFSKDCKYGDMAIGSQTNNIAMRLLDPKAIKNVRLLGSLPVEPIEPGFHSDIFNGKYYLNHSNRIIEMPYERWY